MLTNYEISTAACLGEPGLQERLAQSKMSPSRRFGRLRGTSCLIS
jgi:hypothetical protein